MSTSTVVMLKNVCSSHFCTLIDTCGYGTISCVAHPHHFDGDSDPIPLFTLMRIRIQPLLRWCGSGPDLSRWCGSGSDLSRLCGSGFDLSLSCGSGFGSDLSLWCGCESCASSKLSYANLQDWHVQTLHGSILSLHFSILSILGLPWVLFLSLRNAWTRILL